MNLVMEMNMILMAIVIGIVEESGENLDLTTSSLVEQHSLELQEVKFPQEKVMLQEWFRKKTGKFISVTILKACATIRTLVVMKCKENENMVRRISIKINKICFLLLFKILLELLSVKILLQEIMRVSENMDARCNRTVLKNITFLMMFLRLDLQFLSKLCNLELTV